MVFSHGLKFAPEYLDDIQVFRFGRYVSLHLDLEQNITVKYMCIYSSLGRNIETDIQVFMFKSYICPSI